ncbi:MAG: PHP domain-containing protein [Nitrospiraceae bacterium]|nr:MAG: PHP domain-containing protein [Nitrospiraceae bacterium]
MGCVPLFQFLLLSVYDRTMNFKIDLHVHTKFSGDNYTEPEETVINAIQRNLQGIVFTEHYSYEASEHAESLKEKYRNEIMIFRGVEFSAAEGHCLIFGVNTDKLSMSHAPIEDIVRIVSESGGIVIPSHPFRGGTGIGSIVEKIKGFTAIEGYNGYSHHSQNMKAIEAAKILNLPFTGGSDAHEPGEVGACYTECYEEVTIDNFLTVLKAGNYQGVDTRKVSKAWVF